MDLNAGDLKKVQGLKVINESKLPEKFKRVSIDSRTCRKGDLFFAVRGEKFDGHNFTGRALRNGAACAVVSKTWYNRLGEDRKRSFKKYSIAAVNDTLKAFGELANIYRRKFIIPVIAICGSNGKTSVKDYTAHVLSQKYNVLKTEGNFNNRFGVPLTLFRLNRRHEIAVIELGTNQPGEIKLLSEITAPQFGLITNIGKEHLQYLKSIRGVTKEECELLEYLVKNNGMFFLNSDDKILVKENKKHRLNTFSFGTAGKKADVQGKLEGFRGFNPVIDIRYGKARISTRLSGPGKQSFNAALAAAAAGFYFDVPAGMIKRAVSGYRIESSKRNQLRISKGVRIIDDSYNSNPDSVKAALENLKAYNIQGNKFVVLADMLELGKSSLREHFEIGVLVKKLGFKNLFTYGKESFQTFSGAKGIKNNFHFNDKSVLAEMLKLKVKQGDVVLVKGSRSMKMETVVEEFVS